MLVQSQSYSLRPQTTAHLAQTMSLLELTGEELRQKIESELSSNPALELIDEVKCPNCHRFLSARGPCPVCSRPRTSAIEQPIVFVSPRSSLHSSNSYTTSDDATSPEEWTAAKEDLPTYVLRQIAPELDPLDRPIAAHILSSLDDDGLFRTPITEVVSYHHRPLEHVRKVLRLIQLADPIGVGSPSPKEALLIQLEVLADLQDVPEHAVEIIEKGIQLLSRRAYNELGNLIGISSQQAKKTADFIIENLNPYPARAHWGEVHTSPDTSFTYHNPDIIITCLNGEKEPQLVVEILSPFSGYLRVNPLFKSAIPDAPEDKGEQWQSDVENATLLVKCLQQRNNTIVRLMENLVGLQRKFILRGDAHLIPVTRAHLAEELGVHESTVSRAVANKAVQLPNRRIIPLSKLFDRSLHIRTVLKQIIDQEAKPLSDTQIADLLVKRGYSVARRTVAKYRAMEGILPARLRRCETVPSA